MSTTEAMRRPGRGCILLARTEKEKEEKHPSSYKRVDLDEGSLRDQRVLDDDNNSIDSHIPII